MIEQPQKMPVEVLTNIFELLNVPRKQTPKTITYNKVDIENFLDQLESVIVTLGGNVYE